MKIKVTSEEVELREDFGIVEHEDWVGIINKQSKWFEEASQSTRNAYRKFEAMSEEEQKEQLAEDRETAEKYGLGNPVEGPGRYVVDDMVWLTEAEVAEAGIKGLMSAPVCRQNSQILEAASYQMDEFDLGQLNGWYLYQIIKKRSLVDGSTQGYIVRGVKPVN